MSAEVTFNEGCVVCYGTFISCDTVIGRNVHLQPNASLGHDCQIGDDCVISSYANLAGQCRGGAAHVYWHERGNPRMHRHRRRRHHQHGGPPCLHNIAAGVIAMGNPARAIRANDDKKVFR